MHQAEQAARRAAPWVEWLGRLGYGAKGVVYGLVGLLALQAALGRGGATTDPRGALPLVLQAPFGRALLAVIELGLVGHALWRFVQALLDTEGKGTDLKGLLTRGGYAVVGVIYLGLALTSARLVRGAGDAGGADAPDLTARLMGQPLGRVLVVAVGLAVVGVGLYQIVKGWRGRFRRALRLEQMTAREQRLAERSGRIGLVAHGLALGLIGLFLVVAAWRADPGEARGLGAALATLAQQPFGPWLLGGMALGLLAYAGFNLVEARYRRMIVA